MGRIAFPGVGPVARDGPRFVHRNDEIIVIHLRPF